MIYVLLTENSYERDLVRILENSDFEMIRDIMTFLEKFKTKTKIVSTASR